MLVVVPERRASGGVVPERHVSGDMLVTIPNRAHVNQDALVARNTRVSGRRAHRRYSVGETLRAAWRWLERNPVLLVVIGIAIGVLVFALSLGGARRVTLLPLLAAAAASAMLGAV